MNLTKVVLSSPQAEDEAFLLGMLLAAPHLSPELPNLHPLDFSVPAHRLIWKALVGLAYQEVPLSLLSVSRRLSARGELEMVGGLEYLERLAKGI